MSENGKKEMTMEEFLQGVRNECWMEDTSFVAKTNADGCTAIEEHVWSMNNEHVRTLIRIGADGLIEDCHDCSFAEDLKKRGVRIVG